MSTRSSYQVQGLVTKMRNPDADLRFMALNDLISEIQRSGDQFGIDDATEHQVVEQILSLMNDLNGEVKNLAVKALAALIKHVSESRIQTIIDRLTGFTASKDEGVRDIASLGLKTVVQEIAPGTPLAATCASKLTPKVIQQLESPSSSSELLIDSLDLLSDLLSRFETNIRASVVLQGTSLRALTPLLSNQRLAVRKRAVMTLAVLVSSSGDSMLFESLVHATIVWYLKSGKPELVKTATSLVGALARSSPVKVGRVLPHFLPLILACLDPATAKARSDEEDNHDDDELREVALQTIEVLVLKCPTEVSGSIKQITSYAVEWIKWDPNYASDEADDDIEMDNSSEDGLDGDEDDDFGDEYSDDDDTSWKVRRASTKLLSACISTRSDLLSTFYQTVSPALIARFGEREETVKTEVWATYTVLLAQTKVWGVSGAGSGAGILSSVRGGVTGRDSPMSGGSGRLKRKRSGEQMDVDEGPRALLRQQTPAVAHSIIKQLSAKSLPTRQAGFTLLHELIGVVDGGLETQISPLIQRVEAALKTPDGGLSGAATTLKIEVLSFLGLFFRTHVLRTFLDELTRLVPMITAAIGDKFNKIAAEGFATATELVRVLRPLPDSPNASAGSVSSAVAPHVQAIHEATMQRLASPDADEEVKGKGIVCLGALLFYVGDQLQDDFDRSLGFLRDRLLNEVSRLNAVKVVGDVAESPVCQGPKFDAWTQECLVEVSALLRKAYRPLKVASFSCIKALLNRSGTNLSARASEALLAELQPLINDADINLLPLALDTTALLLTVDAKSSVPAMETTLLPRAYELVQSPLLQGPSLEALLVFFKSYVRAGANPAPLVEHLSHAAETVKKTFDAGGGGGTGAAQGGSGGGMQSLATASRCIGVIVQQAPDVGPGIVDRNSAVIQSSEASSSSLILSLLTLGEVGRVVDMSAHKQTFDKIIEHFSASSEDVRRSAAFAAGGIAVGSSTQLLPVILQLIQSDDKKRYLALQALKEVILHSDSDKLSEISDTLWTPLFENCQAQDEGTRNIAADCLGQLTVTDPAKYLPQLQARLSSDSRHTRATVIAAIRFTFHNESTTYDELLAPLIVEFFNLIDDQDLGVRRLALSSLTSAAHNKPHLVREHLATKLLPELYRQTEVNESLIRIVEMGPFKHKVDDGLDIRKTAYECMHMLMDTCLKEIDVHEFLSRVLMGLTDAEDVKKLCYLMLVKLAHIAPTAVTQRLDDSVPAFQETLQTVLKDNAVKQETERLAELQKAALRCMVILNRRASPTTTPKFCQLVQTTVVGGKWAAEWKDLVQTANSSQWDEDINMEL